MRHVSDEIDGLIQEFVDKHDVDLEQQFKCLVEEVGEVSEAILEEQSDFDIAQELADVMFVARTMNKLLDDLADQHGRIKHHTLLTRVDKELQRRGWQTRIREDYNYGGVHGQIPLYIEKDEYSGFVYIDATGENRERGYGQLCKADILLSSTKTPPNKSFLFYATNDYDNETKAELEWIPRTEAYQRGRKYES